ncbi:DNA-processing protein DprA [Tepidibacillus marianensis]|uniref:DNA-processing protein DprA n=1 Tax=Tepidibacillus marianensis TaxID=3131995 RepID=UPI0030CCE45F
MNERDLLIYLHTANGVGWKTLERLTISFESLQLILDAKPIELSMLAGIDLSIAESIYSHLSKVPITLFQERVEQWKQQGIQILTMKDVEYPRSLKEIAQPPWVIYSKGNIELLHEPALAIVGTRNPTTYGITVTEKLAKDLSQYGWTIVSGMARGIDRIAHETTLSNEGTTIAVLGSGIDVIYPKENQRLYQRLTQKGLVISEYPPETSPIPGYFPQRNRIISGLTKGTLVVEASLKSGSLITAQHALDQSREVFAIPGMITSKRVLGLIF